MDGVLINSEPQHFRAWHRTFLRELNIDITWDPYKGCVGSTDKVLFDIVKEHYGIDISKNTKLLSEYEEDKKAVEAEEGFPIIEGVRETVKALKDRGFRMAVASSSPQSYIDRCVKTVGIASYFDRLYSGRNSKHPKPAPDTFLDAAALIGADPAECIVVEDSENGVKAAKAAGMYCIGFRNLDSGDQDLSPADTVIETIPELLALL